MADYVDKGLKRIGITISKPMLAIICIVFGLMVILFPNLLVWIVGLFLVIQGALLLTDIFEHQWAGTAATVPRGVYCPQCGTRNIEEAIFCKSVAKTSNKAGKRKAAAEPKELTDQYSSSSAFIDGLSKLKGKDASLFSLTSVFLSTSES